MPFTFTTAAHVPLDAIVRAINLVYPKDGDSTDDFAALITPSNLDFAQSVIALDDAGQVAGFAMLGVRGRRGWCGDAAVLPQYQNHKLGQELMRRLSDAGRHIGLCTLQLEVRDENAPARRVYEKEGYHYVRRMPCYAATLDQLGWLSGSPPPGLTVRRLPDRASTWHALLCWVDPRYAAKPCWERELPSLLSLRRADAWLACLGGEDVAFLLAHPSTDRKTLNIVHLALTGSAQPADVAALCVTAATETGVERLRIGMEPYDGRVAAIFRAFGFALDKDLWEMVKELSTPASNAC
jgi:ribosomal protein S18 acetylase RimI-like enzyme